MRAKRILVSTLLALVLPVAAQAASAREPQRIGTAVTALRSARTSAATADLQAAVRDRAEPAAARAHASEALTSLSLGASATALIHAENGAAVESFTYALRALRAGKPATATKKLAEARMLLLYGHDARAALADIRAHRIAKAISAVRRGLSAAERAP